MRNRKSERELPADGGDLENWLHDLVDGETTARRFRKRLRAEGGGATDSTCGVCADAATGTFYFGLDGHEHERRSA